MKIGTVTIHLHQRQDGSWCVYLEHPGPRNRFEGVPESRDVKFRGQFVSAERPTDEALSKLAERHRQTYVVHMAVN